MIDPRAAQGAEEDDPIGAKLEGGVDRELGVRFVLVRSAAFDPNA